MKPILGFLFAALATLIFSGEASSQTKPCNILFQEMDDNNDCMISETEWRGTFVSFYQHDKNQDGILAGKEISKKAKIFSEVLFERLDRNNDQVISKNEWKGNAYTFRKLDSNQDGVLTNSEYLNRRNFAATRPQTSDPFRMMDDNQNGYISPREWDRADAEFARLDRNRDGRISQEEFNVTVETGPFSTMDRNNDGFISTREWDRSDSEFARLDRNRDGRVSLDEFNVKVETDRFSILDRNNDGALSTEEWRATERAFKALDRNRDGKVSRSEFYQKDRYRQTAFYQIDTDYNNWISVEEWSRSGIATETFTAIDRDGNQRLSQAEFDRYYKPPDLADQIFQSIFGIGR